MENDPAGTRPDATADTSETRNVQSDDSSFPKENHTVNVFVEQPGQFNGNGCICANASNLCSFGNYSLSRIILCKTCGYKSLLIHPPKINQNIPCRHLSRSEILVERTEDSLKVKTKEKIEEIETTIKTLTDENGDMSDHLMKITKKNEDLKEEVEKLSKLNSVVTKECKDLRDQVRMLKNSINIDKTCAYSSPALI